MPLTRVGPPGKYLMSPVTVSLAPTLFLFLKILFIYFWREGKGGRKRGRETLMCESHPLVASRTTPTGDLVGSPGMYPDRRSNW